MALINCKASEAVNELTNWKLQCICMTLFRTKTLHKYLFILVYCNYNKEINNAEEL